MSAILGILDPLWAFIGRNMLVSAAVLSIALVVAALLNRPFLVLFLGMAVGTILVLKSEAMQRAEVGHAEPLHVRLPSVPA